MLEPSETVFVEQEDAMTEFKGAVISSETIARGRRIINYLSTSEYDAMDFTDDDNFYNTLNDKVNVARVGASKGRHGVNSEYLYQKWLISPEAERRTVHHTTQRVLGRSYIHTCHVDLKPKTEN